MGMVGGTLVQTVLNKTLSLASMEPLEEKLFEWFRFAKADNYVLCLSKITTSPKLIV